MGTQEHSPVGRQSIAPQSPAGASLAAVLALWRQGAYAQAQQLCERLIAGTGAPEALSLMAEMHVTAGRAPEALPYLRRLVRASPGNASVLRRLGDALLAAVQPEQAARTYRRALQLEPRSARAHNNLGQAVKLLGQRGEAAASYARALEIDPGYAVAHNNLGIELHERGDMAGALEHYRCATESAPQFAEAFHNYGNALLATGRAAQALACFERALALRPQFAEGILARGRVLQRLGRHSEALAACEHALREAPMHVAARSDAANALLSLYRPEEALRYADEAIELDPTLVAAHSNRAGALRLLHQHARAEAACRRALEINPGFAEAWSNLANVLLAMHRNAEAIECCERAIALQPELTAAHAQLAGALYVEKRHDEALQAYARILELEPHRKFLASSLLSTRLACCDWSSYEQDCAALKAAAQDGSAVVVPLTFLSISDDPALQRRVARGYAEDQLPVHARGSAFVRHPSHDRIRVAYLSADFHQHATAVLTAGLFEAHDRTRFEVMGISFGPDDGSALRQRLVQGFERFIEVGERSDAEVAALLRGLEVDIAVDLKGYTGDCRPGIFAQRAAPIQVQYLGYPGTLALPEIDYIVADAIVVPPDQQPHYAEKIVWLPGCYQVNDDRRAIDVDTPRRSEAGLPDEAFVFCCFNNNYKITPTIFDLWMQLLREIPGSVLWLLLDNSLAQTHLRREAAARGVDSGRLVFAERLPTAQHLARHRLADLFLDTLPYNAHTTTSDALWAGLPVLTCAGRSFQARVAASLLQAVGLPELITVDLVEYRSRALTLARDASQLAALRERLASNRLTSPLFDTQRFCAHLELAYTMMHERHRQGQPAQSFHVPVLSRNRHPLPAS